MSHKYPLQDLLRVRKFREDKAAGELSKCRAQLEEAQALVARRHKELTDYIEWRIHREEELYQKVMEQQVQLKALDDLKIDIQILRDKEFAYRERIHEAEQAAAAAQQALDEAHAAFERACKNRQKIDEHKDLWAQEMTKLDEAMQEKEIEDFHVRPLAGADEREAGGHE